MTPLLLILAILIGTGLLYLAMQPSHYLVRRSLPMRIERERVFAQVRDLKTWPAWSPWLIHEPDASLDFSATTDQAGSDYAWDGRRIGAGRLTNVRLDVPSRIEQRIEFVRPFKAVADIWWEFAEREGGTEVSWCMRGGMPFLMRPLIKLTRRMVEKDFELGLAMLRGHLDPDAERPTLRFTGETELAAQRAIAIPFSGGLQDLVAAMRQGFPDLAAQVASQGREPAGPALAAYYKVNPDTLRFVCDIALPVDDQTDPGGFGVARIAGGRYFLTELEGGYGFLEVAWYSLTAHVRMLKLRVDKTRPYLEVYAKDPSAVQHSNEVLTRLYVPIR